MNYPDYKHSIVSIPTSIKKHFNVDDNQHYSLPILDEALKSNPKNVVVLLFDGLGISLLEKHLEPDSFLRRNLKETISSVFPPTTVASTTSIQSGLYPIEHGHLGWTLYFNEVNDNVLHYSNDSDTTGKKLADYHLANTLLPYKDVTEIIKENNSDVDTYIVSPYQGIKADSIKKSMKIIKELCDKDNKKYIYSYWYNPDKYAHIFSTNSYLVHQEIIRINNQVEKLASQLTDTILIITADHSLIDTEFVYLEDYEDLNDYLVMNPSIEMRASALRIKEGKKEEFKEKFNNHLKDKFLLLSSQEVFDQQLFGFGQPTERIKEFVGDFLAIGIGNYNLWTRRGEKILIKANHAGFTSEEFEIPFIMIKKD